MKLTIFEIFNSGKIFKTKDKSMFTIQLFSKKFKIDIKITFFFSVKNFAVF